MELSLQNSSFETMSQEDMVETNGGGLLIAGILGGIVIWVGGTHSVNAIERTSAEAAKNDQNVFEYTFNAYCELGKYLFGD